jgi:hypothetical protein
MRERCFIFTYSRPTITMKKIAAKALPKNIHDKEKILILNAKK